MSDLMRCPCCGRDPRPYAEPGDCVRILCRCGIMTGICQDMEAAIAVWNTRAPAWRREPPDKPGLWVVKNHEYNYFDYWVESFSEETLKMYNSWTEEQLAEASGWGDFGRNSEWLGPLDVPEEE